MSGSEAEGDAWHGERQFCTCLCPSINGGASNRLFLISLFLITVESVLKERERERERERETKSEIWNELEKKKKGR